MSRLILLGGFDNVLQWFGAFGPGERATGGVVAGQEAVEQVLEILLGSWHAVRWALFAEDAKEAFDEIYP